MSIKSEISEEFAALDFPRHEYAYVFIGGKDTPCPLPYVVLPGGESLSFGGHADLEVRTARAEFVCRAINISLGVMNNGEPRRKPPADGYYPT